MTDIAARITDDIGAPVVEGVSAAVKIIEAIVALGLGTSKRGDLAYPLIKPYSGSVGHLSADRHFTPRREHTEARSFKARRSRRIGQRRGERKWTIRGT